MPQMGIMYIIFRNGNKVTIKITYYITYLYTILIMDASQIGSVPVYDSQLDYILRINSRFNKAYILIANS